MLKKLRILISAQHALMLAYRAEIYLWVLAHTLPFIMMSVWVTAAGAPGSGLAMKPVDYARYYAAVFVVRQFSIVWMIYDFEWHVVEGRLSFLLLRPINALWHFVSSHLGEQLARFPFFVVILALFFAIFREAFWIPSPLAIIVGIIAIYAAFALRFALQYCFATLSFWFERASAIDQLSMLPYLFFSGFIIPLDDLPPSLTAVLRYTPFPYFIDFPARIFTGRIAWPEIGSGFAMMAVWFLLLSALGTLMWKRGLLRYSGHGA